MLIATFGPTTALSGKWIAYDDGRFVLQDHGPVSPQAVLEYERQGHLEWASDESRACVVRAAQAPGGHLSAPQRDRTPRRGGTRPAVAVVAVVIALAVIAGVVLIALGNASRVMEKNAQSVSGRIADATGAGGEWTAVYEWSGGGPGADARDSSTFEVEGGHQRLTVSSAASSGTSSPSQTWIVHATGGEAAFTATLTPEVGESKTDLYLPSGTYYLSCNTVACDWTLSLAEQR